VTLDLEMPGMDGLEVLREMAATSDAPVLMVSAHTQADAALTVTALEMGAVDVVAKPRNVLAGGIDELGAELLSKVRAVAGRRWRRPPALRAPDAPRLEKRADDTHADRVVAIASSTGGPAALGYVLSRLPADLPAALLVVQHMPEGFTASLAQRLDASSALLVKEALDGDVLRRGRVLVAPAGRHMRVRRLPGGPVAVLGSGPHVNGHRPSADVLFQSVAAEFGGRSVGVVLTGMGEDGAAGLQSIHRVLGHTVAQDEESSVVFGMPRAAIQKGAADQVLPLERIAEAIEVAVARQVRLDPLRAGLGKVAQ